MIKKLLLVAALLFAQLGHSYAQFADQATYAGSGGGIANAQTITVPNASSLADLLGVLVKYNPTATNTGDTTLQVNGLSSPPHVRKATSGGLVTLTGNEIVSGVPLVVMYDGTYFDIMSAATATLPSLIPQGYLTPCQLSSGSPVSGCTAGFLVPTGDVSGATVLYYEPAFGQGVPIYNGSNFVNFVFSELTLTIPSSRLANTNYDVCIFSNAGTVTVGFSVAWTTSTAGSGARGSGAGTAQITQLQGIWTNAVTATVVNGASTFTVPANQCTIVASVNIDSSAGQVSEHVLYGQSRRWSVYNFYNQQPLLLQAGDPTASWSYLTATWRACNASSTNSGTPMIGLPQSRVAVRLNQILQTTDANSTSDPAIGVGWNSTNTPSGKQGLHYSSVTPVGGVTLKFDALASYDPPGFIGIANANCIENGNGGTSGVFLGTNPNMVLNVSWRG